LQIIENNLFENDTYIKYLVYRLICYCFLDVTLALHKAHCPYNRNECHRGEPKRTRWNRNRVCNGLSIYAAAYKPHVSI